MIVIADHVLFVLLIHFARQYKIFQWFNDYEMNYVWKWHASLTLMLRLGKGKNISARYCIIENLGQEFGLAVLWLFPRDATQSAVMPQ